MHEVEIAAMELETLAELSKAFYHHSVSAVDRHSRGRAGWELLKVNKRRSLLAKEYVELCDTVLSNEELYEWLHFQDVKINSL